MFYFIELKCKNMEIEQSKNMKSLNPKTQSRPRSYILGLMKLKVTSIEYCWMNFIHE